MSDEWEKAVDEWKTEMLQESKVFFRKLYAICALVVISGVVALAVLVDQGHRMENLACATGDIAACRRCQYRELPCATILQRLERGK